MRKNLLEEIKAVDSNAYMQLQNEPYQQIQNYVTLYNAKITGENPP